MSRMSEVHQTIAETLDKYGVVDNIPAMEIEKIAFEYNLTYSLVLEWINTLAESR